MSERIRKYRQKAWDEAMLTLVVERPGLTGEALLTAVIGEATDALARLKEQGAINPPDEDEL